MTDLVALVGISAVVILLPGQDTALEGITGVVPVGLGRRLASESR